MLQANDTTIDKLLGGRVLLKQPAQGYRAAIDPVLLAASIDAKPGERLLELGLGAGAASLCLLARCPEISVTGIEHDKKLAALAQENAVLNRMEQKLGILAAAIDPHSALNELFDQVFANPPYHDARRHSGGSPATHMNENEIEDWIDFSFRHLKAHGYLTLIHRADSLPQLLAALEKRKMGEICILPILPHEGEAAKRVILRAAKERQAPPLFLSPLIMHNRDGCYTAQAEAILRNAVPIPITS